jgi:hypothetical protein
MRRKTFMTNEKKAKHYKNFVLFVAGIFILLLGVTLILVWWKDAVMLFKGSVGMILALAGLFMVYAMSKDW